jgi:hypothetical protein
MYLRQQPRVGEDAVLGRANLAREKPVDLPVGRFVGRGVQPCLQKYFASPVGQIISTSSRHPTPPEGRWPSSRTRGGMRWTRQRFARDGIAGQVERLVSDQQHADERCCCVRQNRVVLTPRRWRQVLRSCVGPTGLRQNISADDGGKTARSPGRARHKPLKPLRAGMPGDSGVLVVARVRSTTTKCTRGRGCNGHPAFPTPSVFLGER